jgi:hypothetical protein
MDISIFKEKAIYYNNLRTSFIQNDFISIDFPKSVENNFLKIVTNIFFLTTYKTWLDYKNFAENKDESSKKTIDELYQKNLKSVRKLVYEYFKVPREKKINTKYLVRLYPFSLKKDDIIKIRYHAHSNNINKILENLEKNIIPEMFLSNPENSLFVVKDVLYY